MIKIKKIEISNYRSCIETKIDINEDLTALIGINGVGKSNIMNSILLLGKINRNRYFHQKEIKDTLLNAQLNIRFDYKGTDYHLRADVYYDTDDTNSEEIYSADLKIRNISKKSRRWDKVDPELFEFANYLKRSKRDYRFVEQRFNKKLTSEKTQLALVLLSYFMEASYYSATQFSDPTKSPISLELEENRLMRPYRRSRTHEQFIFDLYSSFEQDKNSFEQFLNTVNKNGIGLVDDISFIVHNLPSNRYKVKAGGVIQQFETKKSIVVPSITIDNLNLSPNQLSEGTFKTLALVFYILNDDSDLLLIEEPEVCVHHGLLNSIIELIKIKSKDKQIFISTHSDFVLDKLRPENIILVKKDSSSGTIAQPLSKSMSKNDYKALKEYLCEAGNLGEYWKEGGFDNE